MNKFYYLIVLAFATLTFSCTDDENGNEKQNPAQTEIKSVATGLEAVPGMMTFAESLRQLDLGNVEGNEFTLLGVPNSALSLRTTTPNFIPTDDLKRHIIAGKFNLEKLRSLKKIKTISGDSLAITVDNNIVSINGIAIDSVKTISNSLVLFVNKLVPSIPEKTVVFEVWNWNENWSSENNVEAMKTEVATIKIYNQANSSLIATLTTDTAGRATFNQVPDLTYYYTVEKGDQKILYKGYSVYGIITTQAQVEALPIYPVDYNKTIGGLLLKDVNGDGKIDDNDKMPNAFISITKQKEVVHLISDKYAWPVQVSGIDSISQLYMNDCSLRFSRATKFFSDIDKTYSNLSKRQTLTTTDVPIDSLWMNSYITIGRINALLDIQGSNTPAQNRYRADLKLWRATLFLNLTIMFGDVPMPITASGMSYLPRTRVSDVYSLALTDLDVATQATSVNSNKIDALNNAALIYLMKKDYAKALEKANTILNSGTINVTSDKVRYLKALYFKLEALIELGRNADALVAFNQFEAVTTKGKTATATLEYMRSTSRDIFNQYTDGTYNLTYANMVRWGGNASWGKYMLLPIPRKEIEANPMMVQNPGW